MHMWIIRYAIIFRNGNKWEKERTTRADNIIEAKRKAAAIMEKAGSLPLVDKVILRAIVLEGRGR